MSTTEDRLAAARWVAMALEEEVHRLQTELDRVKQEYEDVTRAQQATIKFYVERCLEQDEILDQEFGTEAQVREFIRPKFLESPLGDLTVRAKDWPAQ